MDNDEFQQLLTSGTPVKLEEKQGILQRLFFKKRSIILDEEGFSLPHFNKRYRWNQVSDFRAGVDNVKKQPQTVAFSENFADEGKAFIGPRLCNYATLYGLTAVQLAQLMNHWRERALSQKE